MFNRTSNAFLHGAPLKQIQTEGMGETSTAQQRSKSVGFLCPVGRDGTCPTCRQYAYAFAPCCAWNSQTQGVSALQNMSSWPCATHLPRHSLATPQTSSSAPGRHSCPWCCGTACTSAGWCPRSARPLHKAHRGSVRTHTDPQPFDRKSSFQNLR